MGVGYYLVGVGNVVKYYYVGGSSVNDSIDFERVDSLLNVLDLLYVGGEDDFITSIVIAKVFRLLFDEVCNVEDVWCLFSVVGAYVLLRGELDSSAKFYIVPQCDLERFLNNVYKDGVSIK